MERAAPSLDAIASDQSGPGGRDTPAPPPEDSRSTSSTSSPAGADNEESDFFHGGNDSQSSLGVPNIEDMQVNDDDDVCLTGVSSLPNEILISIFAKLNSAGDLFHCMLVSKRWAKNAVDLLWHRPACTNWRNHSIICRTLALDNPYFVYRSFIKRLNLAATGLADKISDGSVAPLANCTRVERLTLTNCKDLTDSGLVPLVQDSTSLLALDISGDDHITDTSIRTIAEHCKRLQGLNISGCRLVTNDSMIILAQNCKYIKRLKLNECAQLQDHAIMAFAENCPNILEIDLHQCNQIGNEPITNLISKGKSLRELRLAGCEPIDDSAFLSLPPNRTYDHLRILDLTSCDRLTDSAVQKIIAVAPRLRNLVLAKCRNITDVAVHAISGLGKNLHYLHLGHCSNITDDSVKRLVASCNRIRYIDLGCCTHLTDDSVTRLAALPKLKRIGLVKCYRITDESVFALARANHRPRARRDHHGNIVREEYYASSLERVHLSYCAHLTLKSIIRLLNFCPRLTHLSLTGVTAFLREEFSAFCRPPPPEFTDHQRGVFCVFSGPGVSRLRDYLNESPEYESLREWAQVRQHRGVQVQHPGPLANAGVAYPQSVAPAHGPMAMDNQYGEGDGPEGTEEEEAFEGLEGSEMALDQQPGAVQAAHNLFNPHAAAGVPPPPPPPQMIPPSLDLNQGATPTVLPRGQDQASFFIPMPSSQTQSASQARNPPTVISSFHQADPGPASAATISPPNAHARPAAPILGGQSPGQGASTAFMSSSPPHGDANLPNSRGAQDP